MKTSTERLCRREQAGFSLLEVMLVVAIGSVVTAITVFAFQAARFQIAGDANMRLLSSQLQTAREIAITQRRYVQVQFTGNNEIDIIRRNLPGGQTALSRVFFENNARFLVFPGIPDTPDGFGNQTPVVFSSDVYMFGPDGMLADNAGAPVNGTVFLGVPGKPETARAVTVLGATGRITSYRWIGNQWGR